MTVEHAQIKVLLHYYSRITITHSNVNCTMTSAIRVHFCLSKNNQVNGLFHFSETIINYQNFFNQIKRCIRIGKYSVIYFSSLISTSIVRID